MFKLGIVKKVPCPLSKINLHYQTVIDQRLTVIHQLFIWTSAGPSKCSIYKMCGSQGHLTVWRVPSVPSVLDENSFTELFSKWINIQIRHCKKFHCPLSKTSLHYQTVIDQRLTVFHQLFSWTPVGPSKCPFEKIIGSEGHLTVWEVPLGPSVLAKNSITEIFLQMNNFWK